MKKHLTRNRKCGIINKFAAKPDGSRRAGQRARKITDSDLPGEKRFEKNLKNLLTNNLKCGIIKRLTT